MKKIYNETFYEGISGLFAVECDLGSVTGMKRDNIVYEDKGNVFTATGTYEGFEIKAEITEKNGVYLRKDTFTNTSDKTIELNKYSCRFSLQGGKSEVYTQHTEWMNESGGGWQPLINRVTVKNTSNRMTDGGAPFMAVWSNSSKIGTAFHIVSNSKWQIDAFRAFVPSRSNLTIVETGFNDSALRLKVLPGETINVPEIIFFDFKDKVGMGAEKLHAFINDYMPRRTLPAIYNSWLFNMDNVTYDIINSQIKTAAELGLEYFVLDAGWFGKGQVWSASIGDWKENMTGGYAGRMKDVADSVRAAGLKFGLWLEPERAVGGSDCVKEHPDYYIKVDNNVVYDWDVYFLDFANDEAREYITKVTFDLIEKYGIEFIKFDFNWSLKTDNNKSAFYRYHQGHRKYIEDIRKVYPNIYLENCAGGGFRMELGQMKLFDTAWFSDNQDPYMGTRIYRDTLLRMPPCMIEKWGTFKSEYDIRYDREGNEIKKELIVAARGSTWAKTSSVPMNYMKGFLSCGPFGLSMNLNSLSEKAKKEMIEFVKNFKENREFYRTCNCRVMASEDNLSVLHYFDSKFEKNIFAAFHENIDHDGLTVYPALDENAMYILNGEKVSGKDIMKNGLELPISSDMGADGYVEVILNKVKNK